MISNNSLIVLSETYLKGFIRLNIENGFLRIFELSKKENINKDYLSYTVFKRLIDSEFAYELDDSFFRELLFVSTKWASKEDIKQRSKPKSANDIKEKRDTIYFVSLIQSLTSYLIRKNNISDKDLSCKTIKSIKYEYELSQYLNIVHELICHK